VGNIQGTLREFRRLPLSHCRYWGGGPDPPGTALKFHIVGTGGRCLGVTCSPPPPPLKAIRRPPREHSGNIQGAFREHSGNIQETFRERGQLLKQYFQKAASTLQTGTKTKEQPRLLDLLYNNSYDFLLVEPPSIFPKQPPDWWSPKVYSLSDHLISRAPHVYSPM
jgi:hypothetical protein